MSIWNDISWATGLRTPFFNVFFETITLMGYPLFLILFLCFGYFALGSKRFFYTAMLLLFTGLANSLLKDLGQDPRPDAVFALDDRVSTSYGWPSGHMQVAIVLWGYLAYTMQQKWAVWAAVIFIGLQGFSRLYLGVHDLGDVFAGLVFGLMCLYGFLAAMRHPRISDGLARLSLTQGATLMLVWHGVFLLLYPRHEGHDVSYWFTGLMLGWYIGWRLVARQEVTLPGAKPVQLAVAGGLTGLCFIAMMVTTRLASRLGMDEGLVGALANYASGAAFGIFVIWALPRLVTGLTAGLSSRRQSGA